MNEFKDLPNCPFCGTPPDDMFDSWGRVFCVPCDITIPVEDWKNVNKIKAEDEIERLQDENRLLSRVQDIFDNAEEVDHALSDDELNKIKAEAVREYAKSRGLADCEAINYANKLERGEL